MLTSWSERDFRKPSGGPSPEVVEAPGGARSRRGAHLRLPAASPAPLPAPPRAARPPPAAAAAAAPPRPGSLVAARRGGEGAASGGGLISVAGSFLRSLVRNPAAAAAPRASGAAGTAGNSGSDRGGSGRPAVGGNGDARILWVPSARRLGAPCPAAVGSGRGAVTRRRPPGPTCFGPWLAVPLPGSRGAEENPYSRAGQAAWGERPPQEEALEGRAGGSLGWGSASGRRGLRLPEVSAGSSGRRSRGRGDRAGPAPMALASQVAPCTSPRAERSGVGLGRRTSEGTTVSHPKFAISRSPTGCWDRGPYPSFPLVAFAAFSEPSPVPADRSPHLSTPVSLPPVLFTSFRGEIVHGWAPVGVSESSWGGAPGDESLCRVRLNGEGAFSLGEQHPGSSPRSSTPLGRQQPEVLGGSGLSFEEAAVCGSSGELRAPSAFNCAGSAQPG